MDIVEPLADGGGEDAGSTAMILYHKVSWLLHGDEQSQGRTVDEQVVDLRRQR